MHKVKITIYLPQFQALGYQMCSGEFLETSVNCIRREIENCEGPPTLLIVHSLAGGTGSGLGTRITEACHDEFDDVTRINLAITPYHFGEVVVQHYNALLSMAKISASSHATILFENEVAQNLCKQMRGIERPTLDDINAVISSNIVPCLLPKYQRSPRRRCFSLLSDDVVHLCSHPGYRFLDVKNVPQTYAKSIEFTYDSWGSMLNTLMRMQVRGSASERGLGSSGLDLSTACPSIGSILTLHGVDSAEAAEETATSRTSANGPSGSDTSAIYGAAAPTATAGTVASRHGRLPHRVEGSARDSYGSSWASPAGEDVAGGEKASGAGGATGAGGAGSLSGGTECVSESPEIHLSRRVGGGSASCARSSVGTASSSSTPREKSLGGGMAGRSIKHYFLAPYVSMLQAPVQIHHSPVTINDYQRSVSLLTNGASILPLLQRVTHKAADLYGVKAYLHQYTEHGLEDQDFVCAFRNVGQVVQNYRALSLS